jgi:cell division protein FtsW (lipid II flippase)
MIKSITAILMVLGELIDPTTHIVSYAFCPFIFGGSAIYAIVRWVKLEPNQKREIIWSILVIILAVLVLVFVGLNTFLWLNDIMYFIFIAVRFSLLLILVILANPYIKWAPLKGPFITKENEKKT